MGKFPTSPRKPKPPELRHRKPSNGGEPDAVRKAADEALSAEWQSVSGSGWPKGTGREPVNPPSRKKGWFS